MQDLSIQLNNSEKNRVLESSQGAVAVPHNGLRGPKNRRNPAVSCKKLQFVPTECRSLSMQSTEIKRLLFLGSLQSHSREKYWFKLRNSWKHAVLATNQARKDLKTAISRAGPVRQTLLFVPATVRRLSSLPFPALTHFRLILGLENAPRRWTACGADAVVGLAPPSSSEVRAV